MRKRMLAAIGTVFLGLGIAKAGEVKVNFDGSSVATMSFMEAIKDSDSGKMIK